MSRLVRAPRPKPGERGGPQLVERLRRGGALGVALRAPSRWSTVLEVLLAVSLLAAAAGAALLVAGCDGCAGEASADAAPCWCDPRLCTANGECHCPNDAGVFVRCD